MRGAAQGIREAASAALRRRTQRGGAKGYRCPVSARVPSGPGRAARGGPAAARPASSQRSRRRRAAAPPRPATVICVSLSCSIHEHEPWPQRGFVRLCSFLIVPGPPVATHCGRVRALFGATRTGARRTRGSDRTTAVS
ncbi:unnamed protein product [Prorocentrum cordatum]|uniref:Uncharacterized protein n=1 Tax=Prorocentrum cordatum TaxID=2364126 RepID=A0ABN9PUT3_9DINO|nr:unnamed protein product [Polarella glacialis]